MEGDEMAFQIVLVEPEIPPNTGNVARTCAATGTRLHLVEPLGYSLEDKYLKRAGLDYWQYVNLEIHSSLEDFLDKYKEGQMFFSTTRGKNLYTDVSYNQDCFILFGKETAGLPKWLLAEYPEKNIRIPMNKETGERSLNLSNSVNIILYEALRQTGFKGLF